MSRRSGESRQDGQPPTVAWMRAARQPLDTRRAGRDASRGAWRDRRHAPSSSLHVGQRDELRARRVRGRRVGARRHGVEARLQLAVFVAQLPGTCPRAAPPAGRCAARRPSWPPPAPALRSTAPTATPSRLPRSVCNDSRPEAGRMPAPFASWVLYWRSMASPRKTLLLVDADEASRERLAHILKRDARVLRANSAEAALGMLGRDGVDLVLADHALPGVNGFDFLRIVRENYPLAEFVMLADTARRRHDGGGREARRLPRAGQGRRAGGRALDRRARRRAPGSQPPGAGARRPGPRSERRSRVRLRPQPGDPRGARARAQGGRACRPRCSSSARAAPARSWWRG